ncbi:YIP1 family protein [Desulfosarcina alkanivorans]|jgi:hypothetical protein|uniref:YIP1 family protein n=1 Tax=Desulfosarcina alkanivorans TaxID=571177 RepID=UPI0038B2E0A8
MQVILTNVYNLLKDIVVNPFNVFKEIRDGAFKNETLLIFITVTVLSFIKSGGLSGVHRETVHFYSSDKLNYFFSLLSIPQVNWLITFVSFFVFILLIYLIFNLKDSPKMEPLLLSLLSISGIGLIFHVLSILLRYFFPHTPFNYLVYFVYLWTLMLSVFAVKICMNSSFLKSGVVLTIAALPMVFIVGLLAVSPYLIGLSA